MGVHGRTQERVLEQGVASKKSQLLRVGLRLLDSLDGERLQGALAGLNLAKDRAAAR